MKTRITLEEFQNLLIKSRCKEFKDAYQRNFYRDIMFNGMPEFVEVDDDILKIAREKLRIRNMENEILSKTAELNNIGINCEKKGDIKGAIEAYEENIKIGYQATHSYDRLRIIYRKMHDWDNMDRVIKRYADVFGYSQSWADEQCQRYRIKG